MNKMSRQLTVMLVAVFFAVSPGCPGRATPPAQVGAAVVGDDKYPALRVRFSGGVVGFPDIVYAAPPGFRPLTLDLYLPRAGRSPGRALPLVIYVHGGAWRSGHSRAAGAFTDFPGVLASLAARGYAVASLNYRLSGEARYPAATDDLEAALAYLRTHGERFGIDGSRVVLWGSSAGAQIAGLVASGCARSTGRRASDDLRPVTAGCVQGMVAWYGIFELTSLETPASAADSPTAMYLGCPPRACTQLAVAASPIAHVTAAAPPFLLIHGVDDQVVPTEQSRMMERTLRRVGVPVQAIYIPNVGHSWIGRTPALTRQASLEALERTWTFIDSVFAGSH